MKNTLTKALAEKMGKVFDLWSRPEKTLIYYKKCLSIREEIKDKFGIIESMIDLGYLQLNYFDISEAFNYGLKSLDLAKEYGNKDRIRESIALIKAIYKEKHSGYTDIFFINKSTHA